MNGLRDLLVKVSEFSRSKERGLALSALNHRQGATEGVKCLCTPERTSLVIACTEVLCKETQELLTQIEELK